MKITTVKRKAKSVKEAQIESKDQRWHCRNRLSLVFGSNDIEDLESYVYDKDQNVIFKTVKFHQAKSKAIEEIIDNCIDEFYRGHVTEIHIKLSEDGKRVTLIDNGIGFPLKKIPSVYTEFRTGSKFRDEEVDSKGFLNRTLGQNGLGASSTCLTCEEFKVTVRHYNSKKQQTFNFIDGALKTKKGKAKIFKGASGVEIELELAQEVYKNNIIDSEFIRKRIIDLAFLNPGLVFYFNGEKIHFKKGLIELAHKIDMDNAQLIGLDKHIYEGITAKGKKFKGLINIEVALTVDNQSDDRERIISFVNSSPTFDGGFHHDRIKRLFINVIKEKLERVCKKEKINIVDNDILTGLTFLIGIVMPNPRFESQTKRKLVRDARLEKFIEKFMIKNVEKFIRKNKEYIELVIERAKSRHKFQELKDAAKKGKKQKKKRVEKLLDANERRHRDRCTLFICEGDSAIGGLRSARNKLYQGGIALKGKPMNVAQATIKDILNNKEFSDIMASIGLTIGEKPDIDRLRYSQIVFFADSDVDGGHINTLLANFFFQFWPELFEQEIIRIAKAPLYEVITNQGTVYAETDASLEKIKKKHKIKEIQRNKGLGEMSVNAFKHVLNKETYTKISVENMAAAKQMLEVCFGKDTAPRKALLLDEEVAGAPTNTSKQTKKVTKKATKKKTTRKRK